MNDERIEAFRAWLEGEGYRVGTVRKRVTDVKTLAYYPETAQKASALQRQRDYCTAWNLYQEFAEEKGLPRLRGPAPPEPEEKESRRRRRKQGQKREVVSIDVRHFRILRRKVHTAVTPRDAVIRLMLATGLRITDLLRPTRADILNGFRRQDGLIQIEVKGGYTFKTTVNVDREGWRILADHAKGKDNVAAAVAPGGSASVAPGSPAYTIVRRHFQDLCAEVGVDEPHNLHRIRRTVATLVRKKHGRDAAQAVLAHAKGETTEIYTNEFQADTVADALKEL